MSMNLGNPLEPKSTPSCGITIVSVAPTRYSRRSVSLKKLASAQQSEKQAWKGVDLSYIGHPQGLSDRFPVSSNVKDQESQAEKLLQEFAPDMDIRPPLVKFFPVKDHQLISDGVPMNLYSKPSTVQNEELVYKLYHAEGKLVRSVLEQAGFCSTESHDWNVLWAGTVPQRYLFEGLHEYQKINHFPGSEELTRKDRMYENVSRLQNTHGKEQFNFLPETYILPEDFSEFSARFQENPDLIWIAKPNASSQGKGIFLVETLADAMVTEPYIVSQYINNPLLVNNLKFDLRIYVLVTSYDPLRIYLYEEGLARFASEEYASSGSKKNRFMHLTNYSVNKKNEHYVQNEDYRRDNIGHKWSLSALFQHLVSINVDTDFLWMKIYDAVIKSVIAIEDKVVEATKESGLNRSNCFDLFGFDVLIDSNLKPWVLEVNLSPSLATDSPLDLHIKAQLIADTFNLVGVRAFDRKKEALNKIKARLRAKRLVSGKPPSKFSRPQATSHLVKTPEIPSWKLKDVTRDTLEEFSRRGHFLRIFPSKGCEVYDQLFPVQRPANKYIYGLLFGKTDPEAMNGDLNPQPVEYFSMTPRPRTSMVPSGSTDKVEKPVLHLKLKNSSFDQKNGSGKWAKRVATSASRRATVTGDDILMEYISRLITALMKTRDVDLPENWRLSLEEFLNHTVWLTSDQSHDPFWKRLEIKFGEMKERKTQLSRAVLKSSGEQRSEIASLHSIVTSFSIVQMEDYLKTSTSGVTKEVVTPLVAPYPEGILSELTRFLPQSRSKTISHMPNNDPAEEEEQAEFPGFDLQKRTLERIASFSTLRTSWKMSIRPQIRSIAKSVRR